MSLDQARARDMKRTLVTKFIVPFGSKSNRGIITASPDSIRQIGPETVRILRLGEIRFALKPETDERKVDRALRDSQST